MSNKIIVFNDNIIHTPIKEEDIKKLKKYNIDYIGKTCLTEDDFIKYAKDTNIIFNQGFAKITKKVIDNLPGLKAIIRRGIGYDNIDYITAAKKGISVSNTPGFCADEVSTHGIGLLLSFIRKISKGHNLVRSGNWEKLGQEYEDLETLFGENIGIIGFGYVGKMIVKKLIPFGVNIYIYDPYVKIDKKYKIKKVDLNELLKESRYIFLVCPLTKETIDMLDEEQFKIMRKDAVIINIGRGKLINEEVLIKYLKNKKIKGAALDVYKQEPIQKNNPLLKLDNVIFTPHTGGVSNKSLKLSFKMCFDEIIRIAIGEKPLYRVN